MVLLDEEAGTWYCYKDDVLFYATENKWVGSEKPNSGLVEKTPEISLPYHPEPSGAEFLRPSDANPESSIDRQDKPREEGVTGFLWRIALAIGFFILLLIVFYLLIASCFYPTPVDVVHNHNLEISGSATAPHQVNTPKIGFQPPS